ncbi:MAG: DJ-1/PfpI family protein [Candidatus Aenigmarchaeota archaeon]|nr:DJ-1/PfpI family protein [Candidatus Aenigmarchaeota archaeon]
MKKVLMIIAPSDFRDEEYFDTRKVLEEFGFDVKVANSTGQPSKSKFGKIVSPDSNFYEVDSNIYDAIIFVGGMGSAQYFGNNRALELARHFNEDGKIVAAICIAPSILANAGILVGRRATAFPSERDNINAVSTYTGNDVEVDNNIITANGPKAAIEFGKKIAEALK